MLKRLSNTQKPIPTPLPLLPRSGLKRKCETHRDYALWHAVLIAAAYAGEHVLRRSDVTYKSKVCMHVHPKRA